MIHNINLFFSGAILAGAWAIALFFLRFFNQTRDKLFLFFAVAFFLLGLEKVFIFFQPQSEPHSYVYLVRLLAFVLLVFGIIDKNRRSGSR